MLKASLMPPIAAINRSLSALTVASSVGFFIKLPTALLQFLVLPLLTIKEQAMSARISRTFSKQVAFSNRDIPFIQKGSALLESSWQQLNVSVEQLRLLRQPYGLLVLGEQLLSLDQVLLIGDCAKLTLVLTAFGIQALRKKQLSCVQIQQWNECILRVKIGDALAYRQSLGDMKAIAAFMSKHPEHTDALLQRFQIDALLFASVLNDSFGLIVLAKKKPLIAEQLFNAIYACEPLYLSLVNSLFVLTILGQASSLWQEKLLQRLLTQEDEFKRLINTAADLIQLAEDFPMYQTALIHFVMSHNEQFERLLKHHYAFIQVARFFVLATNRLFDHALQPDKITVFFEDNDDLLNVLEQIPSQGQKILCHILANTHDFQRLIQFPYELIKAAEACPSMANTLIETVLADQAEFDRLITNPTEVAECLVQFPTYEAEIFAAWFRQSDLTKLLCGPL